MKTAMQFLDSAHAIHPKMIACGREMITRDVMITILTLPFEAGRGLRGTVNIGYKNPKPVAYLGVFGHAEFKNEHLKLI